jgi:hypothetical protein
MIIVAYGKNPVVLIVKDSIRAITTTAAAGLMQEQRYFQAFKIFAAHQLLGLNQPDLKFCLGV